MPEPPLPQFTQPCSFGASLEPFSPVSHVPTTEQPMPANHNVRKFIDLVRSISGKWANWDPPIPVGVGDYGTLDENGELSVEGNIYDDDFQKHLDENDIKLDLKSHPPELGGPEQDYTVASTGVRKGEFNVNQNIDVPGIASASIKGTWKFRDGKRGALIIVHKPRQKFIPKLVQTKILKAKLLEGKNVVMDAFACSAYLLYLSNKSGETVSVAFCGRTAGTDAVTSELEFGWFTQNESALLRRAFNPNGEYCFIPLYSLRHKAKRSSFPWLGRGEGGTGCSEEHIWQDVYQPWKPLDEDGVEIED